MLARGASRSSAPVPRRDARRRHRTWSAATPSQGRPVWRVGRGPRSWRGSSLQRFPLAPPSPFSRRASWPTPATTRHLAAPMSSSDPRIIGLAPSCGAAEAPSVAGLAHADPSTARHRVVRARGVRHRRAARHVTRWSRCRCFARARHRNEPRTLLLYAAWGVPLFRAFDLIQVQLSHRRAGAALLPFVILVCCSAVGGRHVHVTGALPLVVGPRSPQLVSCYSRCIHGRPTRTTFSRDVALGLGMGVTGRTLTTAVMGRGRLRHAGVRIGHNNAWRATAGLLASPPRSRSACSFRRESVTARRLRSRDGGRASSSSISKLTRPAYRSRRHHPRCVRKVSDAAFVAGFRPWCW